MLVDWTKYDGQSTHLVVKTRFCVRMLYFTAKKSMPITIKFLFFLPVLQNPDSIVRNMIKQNVDLACDFWDDAAVQI